MSSLIGRIVHFRQNDVCEVVLALDDTPPNFTTIPVGVRLTTGVLGLLDSAARNNIDRYTNSPTESGKWHNLGECPYNS